MPDLIDTEPVIVFLAGLAAVVNLGLIAATALDWVALTPASTATIIAFVTAAIALVASTLRAKVWSPASVGDLEADV